jgi:ACR3 family arsenite efflux pump ArsB
VPRSTRSGRTDGVFDQDRAYALVQVALNDLIMLVAFAPIVVLLLGVSNIRVPYDVLIYSVVLYIVIPPDVFRHRISRQKRNLQRHLAQMAWINKRPTTSITAQVTP